MFSMLKMIKYKSLRLTVPLLKNPTFQEEKCQNNPYFYSSYKHYNFKIVIPEKKMWEEYNKEKDPWKRVQILKYIARGPTIFGITI